METVVFVLSGIAAAFGTFNIVAAVWFSGLDLRAESRRRRAEP